MSATRTSFGRPLREPTAWGLLLGLGTFVFALVLGLRMVRGDGDVPVPAESPAAAERAVPPPGPPPTLPPPQSAAPTVRGAMAGRAATGYTLPDGTGWIRVENGAAPLASPTPPALFFAPTVPRPR